MYPIIHFGDISNNYPNFFKRGTFVRGENVERYLTAKELASIPEKHRPIGPVIRTEIKEIDMPVFSKVTNRVEVIFENAVPTTMESENEV